MADLTITAADIEAGSDTLTQRVQYGEAVDPGEVVYLKDSDSKYYKADKNTGSAEAAAKGIAIVGGSTDGYGYIAVSGKFTPGATLAAATLYVLSNDGAISPEGDLTTGDYCVPLFVSISTTAAILLTKSATDGFFFDASASTHA